jgi:HEAT repeat protein
MRTQTASPAYQNFLSSMEISYEDWHDGVGYDLEALKQITDPERDAVVKLLEERLETTPDWRDLEALAAIGTPEARQTIRKALEGGDIETRMRAAEELVALGEEAELESVIIEGLGTTSLGSGLSKAIDLAEEHPSARIQEALLDLSLNGNEDQRIQSAALALYLGGQADEAFDWDHRPFFLRFGDENRAIQIEAYLELCRRLGATPKLT